MKLTIEHLAPYIPYGLKVQWSDGKISTVDIELTESDYMEDKIGGYLLAYSIKQENSLLKPLLRPLSQLTKEIKHNREKLIFSNFYLSVNDIMLIRRTVKLKLHLGDYVHWRTMNTMIKYHFDVFGLIEQNLALPK